MVRTTHRLISPLVLVVLTAAAPATAEPGWVSTSEALALETPAAAQAVDQYLDRQDVRAQLESLGVDPELARLRAAALSQAELAEIAARIEEAPAGGADVLVIVGATFLVLLILEIVGVIDIFKRF